jgi:hypothetical protein
MSTLAAIIDNVEADLRDSTNAIWSSVDLTRAIRWALHELSWATPRRAVATFQAQDGRREYSLAGVGIASSLFLTEAWHPYSDAEPEYPPRSVAWRLLDDDTLYLDVDCINGGDGVRVFYAQAHAIQDLDGAAATTLSAEQEELVCLGAAGYAALQRAQEAIGQVNVTAQAPRLWGDWGQARLQEFRTRLNQLARREMQWRTAWTQGWSL